MVVRVLIFALGFTLLEIGMLGTLALVDVALSFLGGIFIGLLLAWMSSTTRLQKSALIAMVWLALFIVEFSDVVEGYFFTTLLSEASVLLNSFLRSLLSTLVQGVMAGALFLPENHNTNLGSELSSYFKDRLSASWVWRIAVASVAYFPVYFLFGALISPFIIPYYTDPSLGLRIPPLTVIIPLELFRGFLYVASLLPIFAAVWAGRGTVCAVVVLILYIPGALVPLMTQPFLPAGIVPIHLIEILADSVVYGAIATYLLGRKASKVTQ